LSSGNLGRRLTEDANPERVATRDNRRPWRLLQSCDKTNVHLIPRASEQTLPPHAGCPRGDPVLGWNWL